MKMLYKRQQDWPASQSVQLPARPPASPGVGTASSLIQKIQIRYEKAPTGWEFCFLQLCYSNKTCIGVCVRKDRDASAIKQHEWLLDNRKSLRKRVVF